ncbi:MAG: Hpt domain-containing protein, partial [Nodosilinea sp.]
MLTPDKASLAPANGTDSTGEPADLVEAQLQQELRSMFEVDTQKGLQTYLEQSTRLQPHAWTSDIQTLYRAIHTIKGGAVTVGADAILQVSASLEDLLSDLRYLTTAPPLADQQLSNILAEAGELLAATLPIKAQGEQARAQVQPALQRLQQLRKQVQQAYLPQWSEQQMIQQEFAQQGLDLVVLDLEIALENLPAGPLPDSAIHTARSVTDQLRQIGQDLNLSAGWSDLLRQSETLFAELSSSIWRSQWPRLFQAFKDCASQSGQPVVFELRLSEDGLTEPIDQPALQLEAADSAGPAVVEQVDDPSDRLPEPELATDAVADLLGEVEH